MNVMPALQPIICCKTKAIAAAEVLARWVDRDRVLTPGMVEGPIEWAEVDIALTEYLAATFAPQPRPMAKLFLNVSDQTLAEDRYFHRWYKALRRLAAAAPGSVVLEITEGVTSENLAGRWQQLARSGSELALDDFDDGNSSFARLTRYAWHYCKFNVQNVLSRSAQDALAHCKGKGIRAVGERIESEALVQRALAHGMRLQQGFYHGMPALIHQHIEKRQVG